MISCGRETYYKNDQNDEKSQEQEVSLNRSPNLKTFNLFNALKIYQNFKTVKIF